MRRLLWTILAVASVSALVFGTGGFSAATMARDVSVSVAPTHEHAYVSIWDPGAGGSGGQPPAYADEDPVTSPETETKVLVVKNRFADYSLDVTVSDRDGSPVSVSGEYRGLGPGAVAPIMASVDCGDQRGRTDAHLELSVTSTRGDVEAVVHYDAVVFCSGATEPTNGPQSGQSAIPKW